MSKPDLQKVPVHLHEEINLVEQDDLKVAFSKHADAISFLKTIPEEKWSYRYAAGKWSIRQVVQHIIDGERIFCNRTLVIARKDKTTSLVSFDQDEYEAVSKADMRTKDDLINELAALQKSSIKFFGSFDDEQLQTRGTIGNYTIDVNALGFVVIGHTLHHLKLIRERYL
ncbi:MAG TPA: DinB family protein [Chitinophagaceae bacterium]|nr:DinB family protein [Chitinophagaceae bacterium]